MATAGDYTDREGGESFPHEKGSLVLVKWNDGMVYFAKIKKIDHAKRRCVVIFDDRSTDEASFSQIHSVDETTTDIICIKCKKDESEHPNEIVLCDICGIGFHQKCHNPPIPASALELNSPWHCMYCIKQVKNPYLTESIDVMQSLFEEDEDADSTRILPQAVKVKVERQEEEEVHVPTSSTSAAQPALPAPPPPKKRKVGRPRLSETSRRNSGKVRPLEALRRKLAKSTSGPGRSGTYSYRASRKRQTSQQDATSSKYGRTTVESYTIAVQQTSEGILSNSSSAVENNNEEDDESDSDSLIISAKKPRSLRVSLTLPPSIDTSPVSSTTQRSPPNNPPSWQEPALDAPESSPEPMLQIKVEESETEEGGESTESPLTVVTSSSSLEQQKDAPATSEAGPPPLNSTVPPPLVDLESSNHQETQNSSSNDKTSNEDVLVLSSSSSSLEAAAAPDNQKSPSEPVPTVQGSPPEPDVIIIDDESTTSSRKRKSSSSSTNSTSVVTNKSPAETKTPTPSVPPPDRSLVKIVPGVTSLMPSKHKRASVIHTPSPVSTPSPLEQLQMQVQAQLNRNNVYTYGGRRNSYHGSNNSKTVTTSASSPAATTPLSHLNEESVNNRPSSTAIQSQKHPDKIISTASTSRNNNSTVVSVQQQHGKESPTANAGKTTKTNAEKTFSKDIITSTRSRKPLAPPMHYVSEATTKVHEKLRMLYKNSVSLTSDSSSQLVRQPNHHQSTSPSTTYVSIAPAYSSSTPIYSLPSNQAGVHVTYTNSNIPTSPATVVVTPTTITATGEVGTVYTLVQADQATSFQPEMTSHVGGGKDPPLHSPKVAVLTQPPNPGAHTAVVAVAANNDPTIMPAQQQGPSATGTYYTLVEIPDNSDRQATHYAGGSQPTVNTTKPYAVVNALPSGGRQQGSSLQLKSPSYRVQQAGRYRKHRTPSEESPTTVYNKYSPLGVSTTSPSPHHQKQTQPQVPAQDLTSSAISSSNSTNKTLNNKRGKEKEIQTTTVAVIDKEEPLSDLIRQLGAIKSKRKRDFESMSGESLMTLFHSALKQFKENGKKYEQHLSRPAMPPPNVEVLDNSGIPVQQTSRSSKVVRPKPQRVVNQAGVSLLAQHQRAASSPSTSSTSPFPPPSRRISPPPSHRISPPPAYTQQQFSTGSNGKSPSAQQMHRDKAAMYHIQTSGVFVPPEEAVTHKQTSLQKIESYHYKTHQSHVAAPPHSKTPTEGHHFVLSKQPSTQQQAPAKYTQQGHQYSPLTSPHQQVSKHPQGQQHYSFIKPTARQIIKNNRTYLIADSPDAAVNMATGSIVVRRPTHSDIMTTGISHSPVSSSTAAVLQHPPREQEITRSDRICTACGRDATFLCSGCHKEWYCGRECQLKSWDEHATMCKSY